MILIILFVIVILAVLWSGISLLLDFKKCNVPGPTPLPVIGNALYFLGDAVQFLKALSFLMETYGDIAKAFILFDRYILLSNPKYIEPIISSTEHINKGVSYYYLQPWLGLGLLTAGGQKWKGHRKLLTPAFHFNILQTFLPIFLKNQKILIKKLKKLSNGEQIDVFPIMALAALDNITEAAMGVTINAQEDTESLYVKAVHEISELSSKRMRNPALGSDIIFNLLPIKSKQDKALAILHGQTDKVIQERRKLLLDSNITLNNYDDVGVKQKSAFLDLLLLSEKDGYCLDDQSIREEVDTFMFEGHDTTTSALSFILYCISNHEQVQDQLFEEQKNVLADDLDRDPTYTDLLDMKYLELVIKESLRLYPSVPFISRMINQDTNVSGYDIPKNTTAVLNIFGSQRNPKVYENPLAFLPERFESNQQKNVFSWIAFSAGPRNCIGQKFAMMELKVVISSIVRNFILLPGNVKPILCGDLILRSQNGVIVKFAPRS